MLLGLDKALSGLALVILLFLLALRLATELAFNMKMDYLCFYSGDCATELLLSKLIILAEFNFVGD